MSAKATLEQLLAAHPWPKDFAGLPRLEWLWHFELPLSVEQVWPLVVDSSRMNRALGVAEMRFEDRGHARIGTSRPGGVQHEWVEVPWNWVAGQWLESLRVYEKGFSKAVWGVFTFTALGPTRTRVSVYFGAVPRHLLGHLVLKYGFGGLEKDFQRVFGELSGQAGVPAPVFALPAPEPLAPEAEQKLVELEGRLAARGLDRAMIARLFSHLRQGSDDELHRIQIRERARAWGFDEQALLEVALHATREGALEISWDLICPHCRGVTAGTGKASGISAEGACPSCEIDFDTRPPEALEITFRVHPSIRHVERRAYCSAEPARKEHIRLQCDVKPGATVRVAPTLGPGTWRLRLHGAKDYGYLDVADGRAARAEWRASAPARHAVGPAPELELVNDTTAPRRFVLEQARWTDHALRPAQLFSLQAYRDLFSEDYLSTDVQLAVGEQTVLFTDIVGSTAMYAQRGDPVAFMEVKRHFSEVLPLIASHRGALVKTIGDAVMAEFSSPLDAVKASGAIQGCFREGRPDSKTRLRISLNTGPCIAVKLNTGIDYFGQTVNLAAKLQSLAEGGEVAMSEAVFNAPGVRAFLEGKHLDELSYSSKALAAPMPVKRWTV